MSVASEITRIQNAKASLKTSINAKTDQQHQITNETIDDYSDFVDSITTGGGNNNAFIDTTLSYDYSFGIVSLLKSIDLIDTSSIENLRSMFIGCRNLTEVPLLDTSNATSLYTMFQNCYSLETIPLFNTSKVTNMYRMFSGCRNLTKVPLLDTSKVTNMQQMFAGCENLTTVPLFNISSATNMANMFTTCISLSDTSLDNILQMCIGATSFTGNKTLTYMGISSTYYLATRIQALPHYQNFINAGWTIGY